LRRFVQQSRERRKVTTHTLVHLYSKSTETLADLSSAVHRKNAGTNHLCKPTNSRIFRTRAENLRYRSDIVPGPAQRRREAPGFQVLIKNDGRPFA